MKILYFFFSNERILVPFSHVSVWRFGKAVKHKFSIVNKTKTGLLALYSCTVLTCLNTHKWLKYKLYKLHLLNAQKHPNNQQNPPTQHVCEHTPRVCTLRTCSSFSSSAFQDVKLIILIVNSWNVEDGGLMFC